MANINQEIFVLIKSFLFNIFFIFCYLFNTQQSYKTSDYNLNNKRKKSSFLAIAEKLNIASESDYQLPFLSFRRIARRIHNKRKLVSGFLIFEQSIPELFIRLLSSLMKALAE